MIEKMPHVAMEAMEQFQIIDRAFRKHFYYLSYLEPDPKFLPEELPEEKSQLRDFQKRKREEKKERKETGQKNQKKLKSYAKTPLEVGYNRISMSVIFIQGASSSPDFIFIFSRDLIFHGLNT